MTHKRVVNLSVTKEELDLLTVGLKERMDLGLEGKGGLASSLLDTLVHIKKNWTHFEKVL